MSFEVKASNCCSNAIESVVENCVHYLLTKELIKCLYKAFGRPHPFEIAHEVLRIFF